MRWIITFMFSFRIFFVAKANFLSNENLQDMFIYDDCIEGSFMDIQNQEDVLKQFNRASDYYQENIIETAKVVEEKSDLTKLNELASFNKIENVFELIKESGPSHQKMFTVLLILGDERYQSDGSRIKEAQQNAAKLALTQTNYNHPPIKMKKPKDVTLTPTVLLNNICLQKGFKVQYFLLGKNDLESLLNSKNQVVVDYESRSYLKILNDSISLANRSSVLKAKEHDNILGPFTVKVEVEGKYYYGSGRSIQAAKHEAALKAVEDLRSYTIGDYCSLDGYDAECKQMKNSLKSPISLVHEAASVRNIDVEFMEIRMSGPPHNPIFLFRCTLGSFTTEGEGSSKKKAKNDAAHKMLNNLSKLPDIPLDVKMEKIQAKHTTKNKKKKKKLIKNSFDRIAKVFDDTMSFISDKFTGSQENGKADSSNDDSSDYSDYSKLTNKKSSRSSDMLPSAKEELLKIGNMLHFEVNLQNLNKHENLIYSIVQLGLKPSRICLGAGIDGTMAQEKSSSNALKFLFRSGFLEKLSVENNIERFPYEKFIWLQEDAKSV